MTTIKLKNGSGAPLAGDLVQGEPALDLTNKRLYTEDSGGTVIEVGTNPTSVTTGNITATGTATFAGLTTTADVSFGDNDRAIFGAGSDLQIYHDGNNSRIDDTGTGNLVIRAADQLYLGKYTGETYIQASADGPVRLFYNGLDKLQTTATGIDVTGTVTADGLTVDGNIQVNGANAGQLTLDATGQYTQVLFEQNGSSNSGGDILYDHTNDIYALRSLAVGDMQFKTSAVAGTALKRLNIAANGDISFYEDTGTTAKFFWDASQERLELDSANANLLVLERNGGTDANVSIQFNCATNDWYAGTNPANNFAIGTSLDQTNAPFQIDASGNVGIGTSSPDANLEVAGASAGELELVRFRLEGATNNPMLRIFSDEANKLLSINTSGSVSGTELQLGADGSDVLRITSAGDVEIKSGGELIANRADNARNIKLFNDNDFGTIQTSNDPIKIASQVYTRFDVGGTERMRIDSSGNLLVGTTVSPNTLSGASATQGLAFNGSTGYLVAAASGTATAYFNRQSSDGDIAIFRKDGTTVGSIGSVSGARLYIGTQDTGLEFDVSNAITPINTSTGVATDGATTLGASSRRFKDLYLSGGVYLGGTGSANKLDDYEKGTFTARLRGGASEPATLLTTTAQYVVIGNRVWITVAFENVNTTGYAGDIRIDQLPFSCAETRAILTVSTYAGGVWTDQPVGSLASGDTLVYWQDAKTASIWGTVDHNSAGGTRYFWMQGFYKI